MENIEKCECVIGIRKEKKMQITIDSANVKIENGKVTIDLKPDQLVELTCSNKVELSTLKSGDKFKLGDEIFIVLEQTENGTRVIAKEFAYCNVKFGNNPDWKISPIRRKLNNEYFKKIAGIVGEKNILNMRRDLTSLDGLDDYGTCTDWVSLLTSAEYAKYHKILGLKPGYPSWWWLITPMSDRAFYHRPILAMFFADFFIKLRDLERSLLIFRNSLNHVADVIKSG